MKEIIQKQRDFFYTNKTLDFDLRINALRSLKSAILNNENEIYDALKQDLNKSRVESYISEISIVLQELDFMLKNLRKLYFPKKVKSTMGIFPAKSYIQRAPYGVCLIMAPWNYPFQLVMMPLIGAIAGGNTCVVKSSKSTPNVSKIINKILSAFNSVATDGAYVYHVPIDTEYDEVLNQDYDFIFFTGSSNIGKKIALKAAENLTPVVLELGGKSPCIITEDACIRTAARRIVFGKLLNSGQTCVAPDFFLVHSSIRDRFARNLQSQIKSQYLKEPNKNPDFVKIINQKHYDRLTDLINDYPKDKIGGEGNPDTLQISPAILLDVDWDDEVMKNEIFGPIFPIISYDNLDDIINKLRTLNKPLALYLFTKNKEISEKVMSSLQYGGGCINDCIVHLSNHNLPFGGIAQSGIGYYHGKASFETFTHPNSIVSNYPKFDFSFRYPPYNENSEARFKKLLGGTKQ